MPAFFPNNQAGMDTQACGESVHRGAGEQVGHKICGCETLLQLSACLFSEIYNHPSSLPLGVMSVTAAHKICFTFG